MQQQVQVRRQSRARSITIAELATRVHPISGSITCGEVERMLLRTSDATSIVAVATDGVLLLIDRLRFLYLMAGPIGYGRTLHAPHPVEEVVPRAGCLTLPGDTTVAEAFEHLLLRAPDERFQDIIVTLPDGGVAVLESSLLLQRVAESNAEDALRDHLTGLGNRVLVMDTIDQAARIMPDSWVALMFVDLDRFKVVNDGLGHDAGDMLLVVMATRIGDVIRGRGLAARLGGDEFAILVCDASEEGVRSTSEQIATEIVSALGAPVQLGARQITTFASVGIAVAPAQDAAGTLLRCADIAMYQAKRSGGAQHRFFRGDDDAEARQRMDVEIWLRDAIEGERLGVVYQPIVALDGRGLIGFEALVRGHHPERGTLVPGQFLNVASEIGLLPKIDFWVMARGLRQLAAWRAQGAVDLRLSVNVSGRTLGQPGTLERVLEVVRDSNVPPENLTLEVTESEMLHDLPGATELLVNLRRAGVRVAIDDFGTGYSSLSQLAALPLDVLKIDRTFISRIAETGRDIEMVRMILALARGLRVEAVAEGVEDSMQANTLRSMGCEAGQGYLFSPPVDFAAATQMVMREAHRAVTAA